MFLRILALIAAAALAACSQSPEPPVTATPSRKSEAAPQAATSLTTTPAAAPAAQAHETAGIAWRKGDVDAAFAAAKAEGKPVFLYWGAKWCPPCNQVMSTIFNRQDFIERSRHFIPVYVDGDAPNAQKEGARFKVSGYPTMVLFTPDGIEITRLPGEVDAERYMKVLTESMNGAKPVKATLAAALNQATDHHRLVAARRDTLVAARRDTLVAADWRMLAYYSWITDEQQLAAEQDLPATLARLAKACPADQPDTATRLQLQALVAASQAKSKPAVSKGANELLLAVLSDDRRARENFDLLANNAGSIARYVAPRSSAARSQLVATWNAALDRFIADPAIGMDDRLVAVNAKIELARLDTPKGALPEQLLGMVRNEARRADAVTTDVYARQSVISGAAEVLAEAGLLDESDALLKRELSRSHSPYYFMLGLAANAKKRGDKAAAVEWAEKAYAAATGPATRLQWGVSYLRSVIANSPDDAARIERVAGQVIGELEATPETFYERNRRSLERMGKELAAWNKDKKHDASLRRIRGELASVCAKLPSADPARATCDNALSPKKA